MRNIIGYPFSPIVSEEANCGPTALATVLGVDTNEAIELMDSTYQKGWRGYTNVGHIKSALKFKGIEMVKVKTYDNLKNVPAILKPTLLFIQIEGPWMGKGWRSEYNRTHWAFFHNNRAMDVNNPPKTDGIRPKWINIGIWNRKIMKFLVGTYFEGSGWHVRVGYELKENGRLGE